MITVLVVAGEGSELQGIQEGNPSLEILRARDIEETLEKLARNRRIDAVLLLVGEETARFAEAVLEENPAAPPLFAPEESGRGARVNFLDATSASELLRLLERQLEGASGP